MRIRARRRTNDDGGVLPLINVVFLLLIFFMLAGSLSAVDPFEVAPPESLSDGEAEPTAVDILVAEDGRLALDGDVVDEAGLVAAIAARLAREEALSVRLRADGAVAATRVVEVMERLRDAGVTRLRLLTLPKGG